VTGAHQRLRLTSINDGQDVVVDGKMVSYRGGKIIITSVPEKTRYGPPLPGKPACVNTTLLTVPISGGAIQ
jgi:hypothetical protein